MEQSKLISGIIAKFKIAYPYYFKTLTTEEVVGMFNMYQSQIVGYKPEIIIGAIDEIIKKSKFMPSIAEILEKLPTLDFVKNTLKRAKAVTTLEEIGLSNDIKQNSIRVSPYVRSRLTLMRISKMLEY